MARNGLARMHPILDWPRRFRRLQGSRRCRGHGTNRAAGWPCSQRRPQKRKPATHRLTGFDDPSPLRGNRTGVGQISVIRGTTSQSQCRQNTARAFVAGDARARLVPSTIQISRRWVSRRSVAEMHGNRRVGRSVTGLATKVSLAAGGLLPDSDTGSTGIWL